MLKKKHRGLKASDVSELFTNAAVKSTGSRFFRVNWRQYDQDYPQFVVITTAKTARSAVVRSKLRRRIYEMISRNFNDWTVGLRVAILVKSSSVELKPARFREEFMKLMQKIDLFSI